MNVIGIGTDIVECLRIGRMIEGYGELFLQRAYTDREIRHCQARRHAIEHFAGHWAAKEAILKALGVGGRRGLIARIDVEIRHEAGGMTRVLARGAARDLVAARGIGDLLVTIAHCRTYATAYALAVGVPGQRPGHEM